MNKRLEQKYLVKFSYTAVVPIGQLKQETIYKGHGDFTEWFNKEIPAISLSRFNSEVFLQTVTYGEDDQILSITEEKI